jgi:hypothetical protein
MSSQIDLVEKPIRTDTEHLNLKKSVANLRINAHGIPILEEILAEDEVHLANQLKYDGVNKWAIGHRSRAYGEVQGGRDLPPHLWWVGFYAEKELSQLRRNPHILYHGTRLSKLKPIIESGGLKGFREQNDDTEEVYGTSDPTEAMMHAFYFGSHDTYNSDQNTQSLDLSDPVVLLKINLDYMDFSPERRLEIEALSLERYRQMETNEFSSENLLGIELGNKVQLDALTIVLPTDIKGNTHEMELSQFIEHIEK